MLRSSSPFDLAEAPADSCSNPPTPLPFRIDIAIVGGGPQALTLATHLLQKRKQARFVVIDPSGTWMSQWNQQFAAFEIPYLRSPVVHHPVPDPHALRTFAQGRLDELVDPYSRPGSGLFQDFCRDVVDRWQLGRSVYPGRVVRVEPLNRLFRLTLADGQTLMARRVVLAHGGGVIQRPDWLPHLSYPADRLCHSQAIDLRSLNLAGEQVLIVGGGLTSGHLAVGAIARGAKVRLVTRRQLVEKWFDADPGWVGPKYLKDFGLEPDWRVRWQQIQTARNGGSLTPAMLTQLRQLAREGMLTIHGDCQIRAVQWQGASWLVDCDADADAEAPALSGIDRIWLATGTRLDVTQDPLFADVLATYPMPIVQGLPVLDEYLRWRGCELFVMGGLAALQVGPTARNLSGARMACQRIVPALTKASIRRVSV
jgi:hypothetical protein